MFVSLFGTCLLALRSMNTNLFRTSGQAQWPGTVTVSRYRLGDAVRQGDASNGRAVGQTFFRAAVRSKWAKWANPSAFALPLCTLPLPFSPFPLSFFPLSPFFFSPFPL